MELSKVTHSCYLCNELLVGTNISEEHIIPNSIGGRLKSKNLLCSICNKKTGELFDRELAKIGNILANNFNIKRDRGIVPNYIANEIVTEKEVIVSPGLKINYLHPEHGEENGISWIQAHNEKRLLQEIERVKMTLKDENTSLEFIKFENVDVEKKITFYREETMEPNLLFRSICKTMVNFYILKTGDNASVEKIINFLKFDMENMFAWFLNANICKEYHQDKPYHILIIKGDSKQKALYGYYEIFGIRGFAALLNGRYTGEDLLLAYTYDPVSAKEIDADYFHFNLPVTNLIDLIHFKQGLDYYDIFP